jgi:hypothetical protein
MIIEITVGPTLTNFSRTMPYLKNATSAATIPPMMPPSRPRLGAVGECHCGCGEVEEGADNHGCGDEDSGCHEYTGGGGGGGSPPVERRLPAAGLAPTVELPLAGGSLLGGGSG